MIRSASDLLNYLERPGEQRHPLIIASAVRALLIRAGIPDLRDIEEWFLSDDLDNDRWAVLPLIAAHGSEQFAERVAARYLDGDRLRFDDSEEILEYFGKVQYRPARSAMEYYLFEQPDDHYRVRSAAFGLMQFDLADRQDAIFEAVSATLGKALFPEYLPMLAAAMEPPRRREMLEALFRSGRDDASTDCNSGILLAFAHSGADGADLLDRVLADPAWEADDLGTGSARAIYTGWRYTGRHWNELLDRAFTEEDHSLAAYKFRTWLSLLECRLDDADPIPPVRCAQVYDDVELRPWEDMMALAERTSSEDRMRAALRRLEDRVREEVLMDVLLKGT